MNRLVACRAIPFVVFATTMLAAGCGESVSEDEILNYYSRNNIKTLDPISVNTEFAKAVAAQIYEPLYQYHYLDRPYRLIPDVAEGMPEVSEDQMTYTIRIKKGVVFQDDECFPEGKGRELVADDFIYGWKRLADAKLKGTEFWCFDKVTGFNEFREASRGPAATDYTKAISGFEAVDSHTLRIRLNTPYPQLPHVLALVSTAPMPREAVEHYGLDVGSKPVGTGPYKLKEWVRGSRVVLVANPSFREELYPLEGGQDDEMKGLLADKGIRLPFIKKAIFHVITEWQSRFLEFQNDQLDTVLIESNGFEKYFDVTRGNRVMKEFEERGFRGVHVQGMELTYQAVNMDDPVLGTNKKLRQAMCLARDFYMRNKSLYSGVAAMATRFLPKGLPEYDADFRSPYRAARGDFERAKELLAEAGFPGGEGLPEFVFETTSDTMSVRKAENVVNDWAKIGIKCRINKSTWPEFQDKVKEGRAQIFGMGWQADYPDAQNFLQLFYSKNVSPGVNVSNYRNPVFDEMYERATRMADCDERRDLYRRLADIVVEDCPVFVDMMTVRSIGYRAWLKNFKPDVIIDNWLKYWKIEGRSLYVKP